MYPMTAYPVFSLPAGEIIPEYELVVLPAPGADTTTIRSHQAFHPEHDMTPIEGFRSLRAVHRSFDAGCPLQWGTPANPCQEPGEPWKLDHQLACQWVDVAMGRANLDEAPYAITLVSVTQYVWDPDATERLEVLTLVPSHGLEVFPGGPPSGASARAQEGGC